MPAVVAAVPAGAGAPAAPAPVAGKRGPLDARLALGAGAAWLAVLCCVGRGALTSLVLATAALVAGAGVLIATGRRAGLWPALALGAVLRRAGALPARGPDRTGRGRRRCSRWPSGTSRSTSS